MAQPLNNSFETWTTPGDPNSPSGTLPNWTAYSENSGVFYRGTPGYDGTYRADMRSLAGGSTTSIGGCISDAFYLSNSLITFWTRQPESTNVTIMFYLLDASNVQLMSQSITPASPINTWVQRSVDVSAYANQNVKIKITQHTNQFGYSYATFIDLVEASGALSKTSTILSDAYIVFPTTHTILSDAKVVIQVLTNINQKFNSVLQVLSNINNKVNSAIRVLSDVTNFVNICKSVLSNINNDFRTKKLILNNVNNDVRFLYSWQKAADGSLQSLGKEYIKVYINSIEQTDVDIDSINIGKDLDVAHTASFDLGRAYDSTKPTMEHTVEIKYNNWILFSGYITSISPSEDPEKMRINCQNEYWKQNQENVYFNVGHKPTDDKELYYDTIQEALVAGFSWNPGIGNFVPQIITCFAESKSDTVSNLITQCGNYGWFYDVDGTRKLWTAGQGSIIELERQVLGENINLYNVINHSFEESVDGIVNKFRVQMGDTVYRKFSSTNSGTSITHTVSFNNFTNQTVSPDWDGTYEVLAKNSSNGYGYGNYPSEENALYQDVFRKYRLNLQSTFESWTDIYEPYIVIYEPTLTGIMNMSGEQLWYYTDSAGIKRIYYGVLYNGFTIDYKKGKVILSDPVYSYQLDENDECIYIRAPRVTIHIGKTTTYNYTEDSNPAVEDPETDVSNPLMFFTAKMGSYPLTILKQSNLSQFSIQVGYTRDYVEDNVLKTEIIPSWDDTNFAKEYADWQLSKTCDKKIKGTITVTLDTVCFYNIDLTKRIYINGITDEPMNITSINYNISDFTATLTLENSRYFNRTISLPSRGE